MNLKDQRAATLKAARDIAQTAKNANRSLTEAEGKTIDGYLAKADELAEQIKGAEASQARLKRLGAMDPTLQDIDVHEQGHGEVFSDDQKAGFVLAIRSKTAYATTVAFTKAPLLAGPVLPASGQQVVEGTSPKSTFSLRDLFEQVAAEGPTVRYYEVSTGTAQVVAEGALKPDAGMTTTPKDKSLLKIATTFQVSDELAEDAPFLIRTLGTQAMRAVMVKENEAIVDALTNASGAATATGPKASALDIVATEIGDQEGINGLTPKALILNPTDLAAIRIAKAATAGSYFIDPLQSGPTTIHGVQLVSTASVPPGTMFLVSEGAGLFYTRGGVRVEAGHNADDWQRNLATVRVEERVLPAIVAPGLVTKITLTA